MPCEDQFADRVGAAGRTREEGETCLVDGNENQLDEEAQEADSQEADCCEPSHLAELLGIGLLATLQKPAATAEMRVNLGLGAAGGSPRPSSHAHALHQTYRALFFPKSFRDAMASSILPGD